jgi:hypothetical protein
MLNRQLAAVTCTEIESLISQSVPESKQLEYKRQLPDTSDKGKREFLNDVSSFANALGGDMLFGISDQDADGNSVGYANSILPIAAGKIDDAKLWLEEVVRNGIAPRLPIAVQEISGFGSEGNDCVLVLRIPNSFASPHVVTFKGGFRFFSRNSAGKYPLDITEVRSQFLATESQAERIREFKQDRIGRLLANDTTLQLSSPRLAVMHVFPLSAFLTNTNQSLSDLNQTFEFGPFGEQGSSRFNLDGRISFCQSASGDATMDSYCQLFFSGVVETVDADLVQGRSPTDSADFVGSVNSGRLEGQIFEAVEKYARGYMKLGIRGPIVVSFAFVNCEGIVLTTGSSRIVRGQNVRLDRPAAVFPDVVVEDLTDYTRADLRPLIDSLWNAFGFPRSLNFDGDGNWNPRY